MLPKRVYKISGISFLIIGAVLLLNSIVSITGYAIIEDVELKTGSLWALWFIAVGAALVVESRRALSSGLEIFISRGAIQRSEDDDKVKDNMVQYMKEIQMIAANPNHGPQEVLGEFHVSPRGHKNIRVAWHYDKAANRLYVDDLLYYRRGNKYVDNWNSRASQGRIKKKDYEKSGYQPLTMWFSAFSTKTSEKNDMAFLPSS